MKQVSMGSLDGSERGVSKSSGKKRRYRARFWAKEPSGRADGGELSTSLEALTKVATGSYFSTMRSVGLKALKNKLSEYVRLAAGGETVLVTDRDRVVAEIIAPRPGRGPLLADALLADAVREGWLTPPLVTAVGAPPRKPVMVLRDLLDELQHDRGDR